MSIQPAEWDSERGCAVGSTKNAKSINSVLEYVKANLLLKKRELDEKGRQISAHSLKNYYLGIEIESRTILEIFRENNDRCKGLINIDFAPGTIERYATCFQHVETFIKQNYRRDTMCLQEKTPMFIRDFEYYLKTTRKCCHNTAIKYLKNFKKIIRIALANGWMKSDPFSNIKFHLDDVDMDFLDETELNTLMEKELKIERLQIVEDTFLFCCFTGLVDPVEHLRGY